MPRKNRLVLYLSPATGLTLVTASGRVAYHLDPDTVTDLVRAWTASARSDWKLKQWEREVGRKRGGVARARRPARAHVE